MAMQMGPRSALELNTHWAAERLPYRLDRRGVAHLWAVFPAGCELETPLLFIVGSEGHAVAQALRWAACSEITASTASAA